MHAKQQRFTVAAISLLFILLSQAYLWQSLPPSLPFSLSWVPDHILTVTNVHSPDMMSPPLQIGDIIVAVDDRLIQPLQPVFTPPLHNTYTISALRDGQVFESELKLEHEQSQIVLVYLVVSLFLWVVGLTVWRFNIRQDTTAFPIGAVFILLATVFMGLPATFWGIPIAAQINHLLIHFVGISLFYLGFFPRSTSLSRRWKQAFTFLTILALIGFAGALFESVYLFPNGTSIQALIGVSWISLSYLWIAVGFVSIPINIWWRRRHTTSLYLHQQLSTLLLFVSLGTLPTVLLTILPSILWGQMWLPQVMGFTLMTLLPIGYLFILYRQTSPQLDKQMTQLLVVLTTAYMLVLIYLGLLALVENQTGILTNIPTAFLLIPFIVLAFYANSPLERSIGRILSSSGGLDEAFVAEASAQLVREPSWKQLEHIVQLVSERLGSEQVLVRWIVDDLLPTIVIGFEEGDSAENSNPITARFPTPANKWYALDLPLRVGNAELGYWHLSEPRAIGFFSHRQIQLLTQLADMFAMSTQIVRVHEASELFAVRTLYKREIERHMLASRIHDDPLQLVIYVHNQLRHAQKTNTQASAIDAVDGLLKRISRDLRRISEGLQPSLLEDGLHVMMRSIIERFREISAIEVSLNDSQVPRDCAISDTTLLCCYHIMQESLNNVAKHAVAQRIDVVISADATHLQLSITDNGVGIPKMALSPDRVIEEYIVPSGILQMQRWAKIGRGTLSLHSVQPHGLSVRATLHLNAPIPPLGEAIASL